MKIATDEQATEFIKQAEDWCKSTKGLFPVEHARFTIAEFLANQQDLTLYDNRVTE